MNVLNAIKTRNSIRAFLDRPVTRAFLEEILEAGKQCGSFVNTQPWQFAVLGGQVMQEWKDALWQRHLSGETEEREYYCGPMPMDEPYASRGDSFRASIDQLVFPPEDPQREEHRAAYVKSGIIVRDAPCAIILHMPKAMAASPLHLLAAGGVTQAIALAALELGLGSCIMGRPVESPNLIRSLTGIPAENLILCCIALGYIDEDAPINHLRPARADLSELVTWHGI